MPNGRSFLGRALMLAGVMVMLSACEESPAQDGGGDAAAMMGAGGPPPAVTVAQPVVGPISEYSEFSGRFEATDSVEIRSRVSGYLMEIKFEEGAIVQKDTPLFVIDPRQIEATLRQRQADLKLAQSNTTAAVNDFERAQTLFNSGDVSQALLDQRRAARDAALAAVDAAKAGVDSARVDLTYTRISAPITGRIGRAQVTQGNLVSPGEDVLTTIVSMDPIHFYFDVDEKTYLDYARATAGRETGAKINIPVSIALSDERDYTHDGVIDFIDNSIADSTGTMRARAVLDNPDMLLTPGMFGRVKVRTGGNDNGILIPDAAIMIDQSRKYVYVVDDKNTVSSRSIQTGGMDRGMRVVTDGLTGNEWIIVNGLQRAQEGAPVTPQKGEATASNAAGGMPTPAQQENALSVPVDEAAVPADDADMQAEQSGTQQDGAQ